MEDNLKLKILNCIGKIYEESKDCKLEAGFFEKVDSDLAVLSRYFGTTKNQALFIAMVFALNYKGDTVDINDLISYFDCNPMKILEFSDDFDILHASSIFIRQKSRHRLQLAKTNDQFTVNEKITEAILKNEPFPVIQQEKYTDIFVLLEEIYKIGEKRCEEDISTIELLVRTKQLVLSNQQLPLISKITLLDLSLEDTFLYLYLIWKTLSGNESVDIGRVLQGLFDNASQRITYMQDLLAGENVLVKNNYVEIIEASFFNDTGMKLTDTSNDLLLECGIELFAKKKRGENVLLPSEIPSRELLFSESEMSQLFMLKNLLNEDKFKETQTRLSEKNLPKGVAALLHGAPGTGKTEIAKQMARETNRELMKVEISQSKSMWYGESEKIIKRIFTQYRSFAKRCDRMPILLFNEADAIFSKRKEAGTSNIDQTENAMQNIILEEMENFEGILIATTNMAKNLDAAFERRFLFKIQFQKPVPSIRAKIWKSRLPFLKMEDCNLLAEKFDFSGGQIENIFRKKEIYEIVNGQEITLENLMDFCAEETLTENRVRIGF